MMMNAAMFNFLDVTRRHSRIYSRSSESTPGAAAPPATDTLRLPADPHQAEAGTVAAVADALAGNSFSRIELGRGPRVNVIAVAVVVAAARSMADRFARRFERGTDAGVRSHPIWYPHTSQASHEDHFGVSPKCKQIWRCRQCVESTKLRIM